MIGTVRELVDVVSRDREREFERRFLLTPEAFGFFIATVFHRLREETTHRFGEADTNDGSSCVLGCGHRYLCWRGWFCARFWSATDRRSSAKSISTAVIFSCAFACD